MTKLKEKQQITQDLSLVYDLTEKPNKTQLKAEKDRAVVAKLRADLVLPTDKILTVDIDFDSDSGYHNNAIMVMDDFGVDILATAFEVKYGKEHAEKVRNAWTEKQHVDDPRKPTYLLVQKPKSPEKLPKIYAKCGGKEHPPKEAPASLI